MKTATYGRIVFGLSAVLFGVIALMWHDPDTWQSLHRILSLPFGTVVGGCLMIVLIAGGIGMLHPRTARTASIVLAIVYALFALACIPGIVAAPAVFGQYDGFFEQFSLVCGAVAAFATTQANAAQAAAHARFARLGFGLCAISFALAQVVYLRLTADLVPTWMFPGQMFWAITTTIAFALAAVALLVNRQARLALRLLTLMLAIFAVLVWVPLLIAHPETHLNWSEFALTLLITGAAWTVAEATTG